MSMTENEAINELQANIDLPFGFTVTDEVSKIAIKALEEIQQYRAIGTVEELKELKEKNKPRKLKVLKSFDEEYNASWCSCPNCSKGIGWNYQKHFNFCWECGTELDWE